MKTKISEKIEELEKESQREGEIQSIISKVKPFGNGSHLIVPKNFEGKRIKVSLMDDEIRKAKLEAYKEAKKETDEKVEKLKELSFSFFGEELAYEEFRKRVNKIFGEENDKTN